MPLLKSGSTKDTIALQDKVFEENAQSREISDDNEEAVTPKTKRKSFSKNGRKKDPDTRRVCQRACNVKAPDGVCDVC